MERSRPSASNAGTGPETDAERFRAVFQNAALGIGILGRDSRILSVNPALAQILGYSAAELEGLCFYDLLPAQERVRARRGYAEFWELRPPRFTLERTFPRRDGTLVSGRFQLSWVCDDDGTPTSLLVLVEDVTLAKRAADELERERAYLDRLFETSPSAIALVNRGQHIVRVNAEFTRLFGYSSDEVLGRTPGELIAPPEKQAESRLLVERLQRGERFSLETTRRHKDGHLVQVSLTVTPIPIPGDAMAAYAMYTDISERKQMEEALRRASTTDELTGLANRRGFFRQAAREWKRAQRAGEDLLVLFVDVDDFKQVNDTYGHREGDRVLREIAELIQRSVRDTDVTARLGHEGGVLARLGGDEFVVLALGASAGAEQVLAERLQAAMQRYNERHGRPYRISLSVGAARHAPLDATSLDDLLAEADQRMYAQKRARGAGAY